MTSRHFQTILVPTIKEARCEEPTPVDIRLLNDDDLRALERSDPFLYNSIPAIHRMGPSLVDTDKPTARAAKTSYKVSRKTRVSTECHMTALMQEFLMMDEEESFDVQQ